MVIRDISGSARGSGGAREETRLPRAKPEFALKFGSLGATLTMDLGLWVSGQHTHRILEALSFI